MSGRYIFKITILIAALLLVLPTLHSCLSIMVYDYTVAFEFSDLSDSVIVEERLKTLGFKIKDKKQDDATITYQLKKQYQAHDIYFELVSTNHDIRITDSSDNIIITRDDVESVVHSSIGEIISTVSEGFADEFYKYVGYSLFVKSDNFEAEIIGITSNEKGKHKVNLHLWGYDDDNLVLSDEDVLIMKGAISLSTEPLKGTVTLVK